MTFTRFAFLSLDTSNYGGTEQNLRIISDNVDTTFEHSLKKDLQNATAFM